MTSSVTGEWHSQSQFFLRRFLHLLLTISVTLTSAAHHIAVPQSDDEFNVCCLIPSLKSEPKRAMVNSDVTGTSATEGTTQQCADISVRRDWLLASRSKVQCSAIWHSPFEQISKGLKWSGDPSYQDFRRAASAITVVNDSALRANDAAAVQIITYREWGAKALYNTNDKPIRFALKLHDEHG